MCMQNRMKSDGIIFVYYQPALNNKNDFFDFFRPSYVWHLQIISF
jgi:hypothetical protein